MKIWEMYASERAGYLANMPPRELIQFNLTLVIPPSHWNLRLAIQDQISVALGNKLAKALDELAEEAVSAAGAVCEM